MFAMLGALFVVLIGIALAIFAVIAIIAGMVWLFWPLAFFTIIVLLIGYKAGVRESKQKEKKKE